MGPRACETGPRGRFARTAPFFFSRMRFGDFFRLPLSVRGTTRMQRSDVGWMPCDDRRIFAPWTGDVIFSTGGDDKYIIADDLPRLQCKPTAPSSIMSHSPDRQNLGRTMILVPPPPSSSSLSTRACAAHRRMDVSYRAGWDNDDGTCTAWEYGCRGGGGRRREAR